MKSGTRGTHTTKSNGCQVPVAPILTRALLWVPHSSSEIVDDYLFFFLKYVVNKNFHGLEKSKYIWQGCWNQGGRGVNCPPTFAKISPKFLQNGRFCLKFLLFAPPLWTLPPTCRQVPTALMLIFTH